MKIIEHEAKILTSSGWMTETQLHAMNSKEKERPAFTYTPPEPSKTCPFRDGVSKSCTKTTCAWWSDERCAEHCPSQSIGRKCPRNGYNCTTDCALYVGDVKGD